LLLWEANLFLSLLCRFSLGANFFSLGRKGFSFGV